MANQLPPSRVKRSHQHSGHLARVQGDGGRSGVADRIVDVITMHVEDMCIETHIVKVPDHIVIETHFKGRVVGVDITVQLLDHLYVSNCILKKSPRKKFLTGKKFAAI